MFKNYWKVYGKMTQSIEEYVIIISFQMIFHSNNFH